MRLFLSLVMLITTCSTASLGQNSGAARFAAPMMMLPQSSLQADPEEAPASSGDASPAPAAATAAETNPAAASEPQAQAAPKKTQIAAKLLFGGVKTPAPLEARAIGFYSKGCLAGAKAIPVDGPAWQVMRLSRNRNWGHPKLTAWVERFARDAQSLEGWPGLLVGDMSQPRGGPMLTGHASHQIGLDADIWLTPMPNRRLTQTEREELAATTMLPGGNEKSVTVDPAVWTERHAKLIRRAANYAEVERVLVHPAIKKALCEAAPTLGEDRAWLWKVRPYWGHHYHFHVRMSCPPDSTECRPQLATLADDGCGKELTDWLALISRPPPPAPKVPVKPAPPPPPMTLDMLPQECRIVLGGEAAKGG
jgi:penicillin-insensitive murein DD-endopeptidase